MKNSSAASSSLKEYLKKYESNNDEENKKKIKMKKKKPATACVLVVDEDPIWHKPMKQEEESNELPEEAPQVDEDIDVKSMKRLEQIRSRQPYHAISEDGSGWVPVTHAPNLLNSMDSNVDLSPPRKQRGSNIDMSPPLSEKSSKGSHLSSRLDLSPPRRSRNVSSLKELPKTGLLTGQDFSKEYSKTEIANSLRFENMDASLTGEDGVSIHRDKKTGNQISKDEFLKLHKREEKRKEKTLEWGKGLAQKHEAEKRQKEQEIEKSKPFARTRDDSELDLMLRNRKRWGDSMENFTKKKPYDETKLQDLGSSEKMKASGFIIPQEIPNHSWIKRGIDAPPNRYGILPGRHWDGVDRSNGFDKELIKRRNEKQALEKEAYIWSVADM